MPALSRFAFRSAAALIELVSASSPASHIYVLTKMRLVSVHFVSDRVQCARRIDDTVCATKVARNCSELQLDRRAPLLFVSMRRLIVLQTEPRHLHDGIRWRRIGSAGARRPRDEPPPRRAKSA
jgi:hypothetical protein